ncbi:MAG TPA: NADP-dependent oxidoreductase [Candidatus Limnocylindrales bacterium]|nr:NADP-dependent oxidoreductase [Candidatus Limnocylindrales bacterium]
MKAARVLRFGPPEVIVLQDLPVPSPGAGELLVRVEAAGVGPWDALLREGKSALAQTLPLTLGSDIAGRVEAVGAGVSGFHAGEEVFGVTNEQFTGAYAEYALAAAGKMAARPSGLSFLEAASMPVVAVTAWQMLFEYGHAAAGQTVLIHGGAGNVGAYAVQMAKNAGLEVFATAASSDLQYVQSLGAHRVLDYRKEHFDQALRDIDLVLDTVGGETREKSVNVLRPGGILVSVVSPPVSGQTPQGITALFFYADVTTERLNNIIRLFQSGELRTHVGTVLPLEQVQVAHRMLGGLAHAPGKIVLQIARD